MKIFNKRSGKHEVDKRKEKKVAKAAKKAAIKSASSVHAVWGWQG